MDFLFLAYTQNFVSYAGIAIFKSNRADFRNIVRKCNRFVV